MDKEKILVSSCLLGEPVRYDGKSQGQEDIIRLKNLFELIPFCPEVAGGLLIPRSPAEIVRNRVINANGQDVTDEYERGADLALKTCLYLGIKKAILKSRSPSCGMGQIYDGSFSRTLIQGNGVATKKLLDQGISVCSEENLEGLFRK